MSVTFSEEKKLWKKGWKRVAGLDEAGRGPLAGPVVAAAVFVEPGFRFRTVGFENIKDVKKLTPLKREEVYRLILQTPQIKWGTGKVSEKIIDKVNIFEASKMAMRRALQNLEKKLSREFSGKFSRQSKIDFLIIDGNFKIDVFLSQKSIVKADEKVFSCIAASIIAKVTRDRMMQRYHKKYPCYGFDRHKGYSTKFHRQMLRKYGPCKIHRQTFKPVGLAKGKNLC